jgi:hypothetical protein
MLRHAAIASMDVSEEGIASIMRVTRIGELGTTLVVTSKVPLKRGNLKAPGIPRLQ